MEGRNEYIAGGMSYRDKASFRIEKEVPQQFLLRYEEDLEYGLRAPRERPFFTTEEGLDACERVNGWNPNVMRNYITGLQTFGRHVFEVQCKGQDQMNKWMEKTPVVYLGPGRRFIGGEAGALDVSKQAFFKITLSNLPSAIGDDVVFGKLRQYGMPDETRNSEMDVIKYGKWKGYQTGNRVFYMKTIAGELGMPVGFRLKGKWIRCFHFGQVRGMEREEAENKMRGRIIEENKRREEREIEHSMRTEQTTNWCSERDSNQGCDQEGGQQPIDPERPDPSNGPDVGITYKIVNGRAVVDEEPFFAQSELAQNAFKELEALQSEIEEMHQAREREEHEGTKDEVDGNDAENQEDAEEEERKELITRNKKRQPKKARFVQNERSSVNHVGLLISSY